MNISPNVNSFQSVLLQLIISCSSNLNKSTINLENVRKLFILKRVRSSYSDDYYFPRAMRSGEQDCQRKIGHPDLLRR